MATLGARKITDLHGEVPPAGGGVFFCHLDSGAPPDAGPAVLTIGDLDLVGRILPARGGLDAPEHPAIVFAQGAGWRTVLPAPGGSYASAGGVRLSTVLADVARLAGEPYDAPPEVKLGPAYGWDASDPTRPVRAMDVLADLVARKAIPLWRIQHSTDPAKNGRTVFTPWPSTGPADDHGRVADRCLVDGAREVALDSAVAAWLPGATVQGERITRTSFEEHGGELRVVVRVEKAALLSFPAMVRRSILTLLPWLDRIGIAASGALAIRSASERIEMAGGGRAAAGKGHRVGELRIKVIPGAPTQVALFWREKSGDLWSVIAGSDIMIAPLPGDTGTPIYITEGSAKVQIDG